MWNGIHDRESHRDRLLVLLSSCRTANATLAVDKIYALLGLSSDCAEFETNYHQSKAEIYLRFARWHIYKAKSYYTKLPYLIEHQAPILLDP